MAHKKIFSAILFMLMLSSTLLGASYYVDASNGNDSNNGLSPSTAWRTLSKVESILVSLSPGDSVLFKRGETWRPSTSAALIDFPRYFDGGLHGSQDNYIVFGAYGSGAKPILSTGNSSDSYDGKKRVFFIRHASYLIFENLEIRGDILAYTDWSNGAYPNVFIRHIKFLNLDMLGGVESTGAGINFWVYQQESATTPEVFEGNNAGYITIKDCLFKNTQPDHSAIHIRGCEGHHYVGYNEFYNIGRSGINISDGDYNVIEYNLLSGIDGPGIKASGHYGTFDYTTIRGNLVLQAGRVYGGAGIRVTVTRNSKIYNNTVYTNGTPFRLGWGPGDPVPPCDLGTRGMEDNLIANNIFVGDMSYLRRANSVDITYRSGQTYNHSTEWAYNTNDFKHNIYKATRGKVWIFRAWNGSGSYQGVSNYSYSITSNDSHSSESDFNSTWANKTNVINDINQDPVFVNGYWSSPENFGDFRLASSSSGYGTGYIIPEWTHDLEGNPVPSGQQPDRGAFHSSSTGGGDLIPPSLTDATIADPNTVILNFSEELDNSTASNSANYSISGGVTVNSAALSSDGSVVTLSTSDHDYDVSYTITVNDLEDLSGNSIDPNNNSFIYSIPLPPDTTPLVISSVNLANSTTLNINFSEPVGIEAENSSNYSISYSGGNSTGTNLFKVGTGSFENGTESWVAYGGNNINSVSEIAAEGSRSLAIEYVDHSGGAYLYLNQSNDLTADLVVGKEYTVTLWAMVTGGSASIVVSGGGIYEKELTASMEKYEINFTAQSSNTHYIRLSSLSTGETVYIDDVKIFTGSAQSSLPVSSAVLSSDKTIATLSTAEHSTNIQYSVEVNNVKDIEGHLIASTGNSKVYEYVSNADVIPPRLVDVNADSLTLISLTFSEPLQSSSALTISNYSISGGVSIQSAELSQDQTVVHLKTDAHDYDVSYTLTVTNITDLSGNTIDPDSNSGSYSFPSPPDETPPALLSASLLTPNTLKLKFSEPLSDAASETNNYSITHSNSMPSGDNLFDEGAGSYEAGTESWNAYSLNKINSVTQNAVDGERSLAITYVNSSGGAYLYFADAMDLKQNLTVGESYTVSFWAMIESGDARVAVSGGGLSQILVPLTDSMQKYEVEFTALSPNRHYMRLSALGEGETVYIDNVQIYSGLAPTTDEVVVTTASLSEDKTEVLLTTSEHQPEIDYTVNVEYVFDLSGNLISESSSSQSYFLTFDVDEKAPALVDANLTDASTLTLKFSEPVSASAEESSNYVITSNSEFESSVENLFQNGTGSFESGTESWVAYASNQIESVEENAVTGSNSLAIKYVNSSGGAYLYLSSDYDLTKNLIVGEDYTLSFWGKSDMGYARAVLAGGGINTMIIPLSETMKRYEITFTATSPDRHYIRLSSLRRGETVYFDEFRLTTGVVEPNQVSVLAVELTENGDGVLLSTDNHIVGESYSIVVSNVTDEAGNLISPDSSSLNYTFDTQLVKTTDKNGSTISAEDAVPTKYELYNNYPNPFNPSTIIRFALPEVSNVQLKVYNILGQEVAVLVNKEMAVGYHELRFDGSRLSSGVYIYSLKTNNFNAVKKMILTK